MKDRTSLSACLPHRAHAAPRAASADDAGPCAGERVDQGHVVHVSALVRACHRRLGSPLDHAAVADVEQEVLVALWLRWAGHATARPTDAWIFGTARLTILNRLRARTRRHEERYGATTPEPRSLEREPGSAIDTGFRHRLREALAALSTATRQIVIGRCEEALPFRALAESLHLTESAAKARFQRCLPMLRARLGRLWGALYHRG